MSDCPNAEMRDRLPDLLHERLDEGARAAILAHVDDCVDCHLELALLREARIALSPSGVVSVDVMSIARLVVERTGRSPSPSVPSRRHARWGDWRIAASIVLLAIGAGGFAIERGTRQRQSVVPVVSTAAPIVQMPNAGASTSVAIPADRGRDQPNAVASIKSAELSAAGGVSELSESDLQSLLESLNDLDAVPPTESDPVLVRVTLPGTGSSE
jgi:hypothetical protein